MVSATAGFRRADLKSATSLTGWFRCPGAAAAGTDAAAALVMGQVPAKHQVQVAFTEDQDLIQQLTAEGPEDASARRCCCHGVRWLLVTRAGTCSRRTCTLPSGNRRGLGRFAVCV